MKPIKAGWVFRVFLLGIILIGMFQVNIKYVYGDDIETVTLNAVEDSWVNCDYSNDNYGSKTYLRIGYYKKYITYVKFDLSSLGTNIIVTSAELKLYGYGDDIEIATDKTSENWDEDTITWNNKPASEGTLQTKTFGGSGSYVWFTFCDNDNLVDYLNEKLGGTVSFMLRQSVSEEDSTHWSSKESGSDSAPKLTITYVYTTKTVTVLPSDTGYTIPEAGEYNVTYGNDFTVTAYPNEGYAFQKWLVNGKTYFDNPLTITVTEDLTIQPVFVMICLFDVTDLIYLLITIIPAVMMGFVRFKTGSNLGVLFYGITLVVTTYCYIISGILPFYSIILVGLYVFSILIIREGE